nr:hypothetical protein [Leptospira ellisii]
MDPKTATAADPKRKQTRLRRIGGSKREMFVPVFFLFLSAAFSLSAESYDSYRRDDLLLLGDGKRDLTGQGRFFSFRKNETEKRETIPGENEAPGAYANLHAIYRGLTQYGGAEREKADVSFSSYDKKGDIKI